MDITSDDLVHARTIHLWMEWNELKQLILQAAADELAKKASDFTSVVELHQKMEGSPAYRVSEWRASITLVESFKK